MSELEATRWRTYVTCVDLNEPVCRLESCRAPLPPRRTAYCCDKHARAFEEQHVWSAARRAARRRAKWTCERCGFKPNPIKKDPELRAAYSRLALKLEVNHIKPLIGAYRVVTCLNHLSNLEVLCHRCHVEVTGGQRASRAKAATATAAVADMLVAPSPAAISVRASASTSVKPKQPSKRPTPALTSELKREASDSAKKHSRRKAAVVTI